MCNTCLIFVVALKYNSFFFVTKLRINNHKISNVAQTDRNLLTVTNQRVTYARGGVLQLVEVDCCGLGVNSE